MKETESNYLSLIWEQRPFFFKHYSEYESHSFDAA